MIRAGGTSRRLFITVKKQSFCGSKSMNQANEELIPVILVCLRTTEPDDEFDHAIEELRSLVEACGLKDVGIVTQTLPHPDVATWVGSGKARELAQTVHLASAGYAVCLGNLSPSQMKNLQKIIEVPVWDRTNLILEIFSRRARTREAKLQVESAYLKFMMPRLSGMWQHLGRQSGGGGSRANKGIGEKQIELDRRQISHRLTELKKELSRIEQTRNVQRQGRSRDNLPNVALVGYTNAGKSSLMNCLIGMSAGASETDPGKMVFEKDMLFATLDTSIRKIAVPGRKPFLMSDTVGFIENIPHDLIKAFRSTLAEVKFADALLVVIDSSDKHHKAHKKVTEDTLRDLDALSIPRIYVYNKADLKDEGTIAVNSDDKETVYISAKTGYGIDELLDRIEDIFREGSRIINAVIPYTSGELLNRIHKEGEVIEERFEENGTYISAKCPGALADYIESAMENLDYSI